MAEDLIKTGRIVTVFGGSGFVGRHVARALARAGWRIRVATRRPDLAFHLQPLGRVGQIHAVQANVRNAASVAAALRGADAVVNLVAILTEKGAQTFDAVNVGGARAIATAAREAGIGNFVHMSALGADPASESSYARSKAEGEAAVFENIPGAIIARPSTVFGPEDDFFNRFATLARFAPVLPVFGGGATKFQPVYAGDVGETVARALAGEAKPGAIYELGGPEVSSLRDIMQFVCKTTGRRRALLSVPFGASHWAAFGTEIADRLSLGLFPRAAYMTRDQVKLLAQDNVVSAAAKAEGRTLEGLGIAPDSYETTVPTYLGRFRASGQFENQRFA